MEIIAVHVCAVALRRIYKTRAAPAGGHGEGKEASRYLLLELETDTGLRGLGEVSDLEAAWNTPSPEGLQDQLGQALLGTDPRQRQSTWEQACQALPPGMHPELQRLIAAAVDMALLDLEGKAFGVPASALLGGCCRSHLPISWVAYIRGADLLEDEIQLKVREGFTAFKLKVGEDCALDCARVRTLRRLAGPKAHLKVDASGQWEEQEAIDHIRQLAELGVDAVETPLQAASRSLAKDHPEKVNQDPDPVAAALARVRAAVPIPLIEHVADFDDGFSLALLQHRGVDIFNIVPGQAGSLRRAQRLIHLAEAGGVRVLLGSTVELGPGTAAALHLGLASPAVSLPSDLVGPGLLEADVVRPRIRYASGRLQAPRAPGLGVTLDPELVEKYRG